MKIKCSSKRRFKKILSKMMLQYIGNLKESQFYAANNFNCGVNTYKGIDVKFIKVDPILGLKLHKIILMQKIHVQENDSNE